MQEGSLRFRQCQSEGCEDDIEMKRGEDSSVQRSGHIAEDIDGFTAVVQ
jgi:hypothetical protein